MILQSYLICETCVHVEQIPWKEVCSIEEKRKNGHKRLEGGVYILGLRELCRNMAKSTKKKDKQIKRSGQTNF